MSAMSWSMAEIWNSVVEEEEERPVQPRERIYASELGGSLIDCYLKMKGTPYSNRPNARSRRKFYMGDQVEYIIKNVLITAGILISTQDYLIHQYDGLLPVVGKLDFKAGGKPDYKKALEALNKAILDPKQRKFGIRLIESYAERYPDGLKEIILEIKSCSSFMFEEYGIKGNPNKNHLLQDFHYLKSDKIKIGDTVIPRKPMDEGHVTYICREDARMAEYGVFNPSSIEDEYKDYIEKITWHFKNNSIPHLEKPIYYNEELGKFKTNWKMFYSPYLTKLYGFKDQKEYDDMWQGKVARINRVIGRIKKKETMTKNNLAAIEEMKKEGFELPKEIK